MLPSFLARVGAAVKAFRTGRADVSFVDESLGISSENYAPSAYVNYQATSVGVYACTNLRARTLAGVPLRLYKKDKQGDRQAVTSGHCRDLLDKVNPHWTWNRLIQMTEIGLGLVGCGFWALERGANGKGVPKEIWWMRPDKVRVIPDAKNYLRGFLYEENGVSIFFLPSEVIWFRYPNVADQFSGLSPIAAARLSIETSAGAMRSNKRIFDRGYQVNGIVSPGDKDQRMTREQAAELEALIGRRLRGEDKAHSLAVLPQHVNVQPLSLSPKDAEFMGLMRWSLADVCRVYQTPPILVQDFEKATYSNAEQAYKAFWTDCIKPEGQMIASEVTEQLLPMFDGEADEAEFDYSGVPVLQEDQTEVTEQAKTWVGIGVPLNRVLQVYAPQLLPKGGGGYPWGDEPQALALPAGEPGKPGKPAAPEEEPEDEEEDEEDDGSPAAAARLALKALRAMRKGIVYGSKEHQAKARRFSRAIDRHQKRVKVTATRLLTEQATALVKDLRARDEAKAAVTDEFDDEFWNALFAEEITPDLQAAAQAAGEATMTDVGASIDFDISHPEVALFLAERAQRFAEEVNETTWERLKETLTEGREAGEDIDELAQRVEDEMADRIRSSAETIARTETMGALNGGALLAAQQSGVVDGKGWLASVDGRERATHAKAHKKYQAAAIPLSEDFKVGRGSGPAPGQIGLAEEDIACRCTMTFVIKDDDGEERAIPSTVVAGIQQWLERGGET